MMSSPLFRIFMAMYLAIWSPAMCCCAIKGGLGRVTGVQVACCSQREAVAECTPRDAMAMQGSSHSCCAKLQVAQTSDDQPAPASGEGCKCRDRSTQLGQVSPTAKFVAMTLTLHLLAIMVHDAQPVAAHIENAKWNRTWQLAHGPPRESLFDQHCLLTV